MGHHRHARRSRRHCSDANGAWITFEERERGSLAPGKLAVIEPPYGVRRRVRRNLMAFLRLRRQRFVSAGGRFRRMILPACSSASILRESADALNFREEAIGT
jgi:hypothetical protein